MEWLDRIVDDSERRTFELWEVPQPDLHLYLQLNEAWPRECGAGNSEPSPTKAQCARPSTALPTFAVVRAHVRIVVSAPVPTRAPL
jgi:hypothetical protein